MRVGTWNLQGRWDERHAALLSDQDCDVWLLTEVSHRAQLDGGCLTRTTTPMAPDCAWAAVWSKQAHEPLRQPHPASAAARLEDVVLCSSVLPWRSCGGEAPWVAGSTAEKTAAVLSDLDRELPTGAFVWGGDWNHSLSGQEVVGSKAGRAAVQAFLDTRGMVAATRELPSSVEGVLSIDHIAAPIGWSATERHVVAAEGGVRLSDHDAYVVDLQG